MCIRDSGLGHHHLELPAERLLVEAHRLGAAAVEEQVGVELAHFVSLAADVRCIASKPSAAFCTSAGKSAISWTWRISMISLGPPGQRLAHSIASSRERT